MEIVDRLNALSAKVQSQAKLIKTEEAAKNAFVMPFISTVLGYDVFNPLEVVPEFVADVGIKKGEKIDYAIMRDGEVQILIECKKSNSALKLEHASQLYRYFGVTSARIAVLTNGEVYQFYTDLDAPNRMDEKPFLELNMHDIDDTLIPELRKLTKGSFNLESVLNAAGDLKYVGQIKRIVSSEFKEPSEEWIRYFAIRVYEGAVTQRIKDQFAPLVRKAGQQYLADQVNDRLKAALGESGFARTVSADEAEVRSPDSVADDVPDDGIETTFEELEGFQIIRAIVCSEVRVERIGHRDAKSYFAVLLDDNNRKPVARLHFNRKQKYLGVFDEGKVETRIPIDALEEIYSHAEYLRATIRRYEAE